MFHLKISHLNVQRVRDAIFFHSEGVVVLMRIRIFIIFSHFSCKGRKKLNLKKYLLIDTIDERALIEKCMQSTKKIFTYLFLILFFQA